MSDNKYFKSSSFWEIFVELDDKAAENFADFAATGLFDTNKVVGKLAVWSCKLRKMEDNPLKSQVYTIVYNKKTYHRQIMNNYLSDLKKLLLSFIQLNWLQSNPALQRYAVTDSFLKMGLNKQFEKEVVASKQKTKLVDASEMLYQIKLNQLDDEYAATQIKKRVYHKLESVTHAFAVYYFIETMRMYCELVNRKNLRNQPFNEQEMVHFFAYYQQQNEQVKAHPLLQIYASILAFLRAPDSGETFSNYKSILHRSISGFSVQTAREVCLYGQNQCIAHINKNNANYLQELFELYNLMLQENIMYEGPYMTQYTFKNYVTVALRLKAFEAAENFVYNYKNKLHPLQQENAFHYNLAAIYFESDNFKKSMSELHAIQINDPVYYLDSRCIILKIYYIEGDYEALASLYNSVRVYLLRLKQLPKKQVDLYNYLFLYTYKLSNIARLKAYEQTSLLLQKTNKLIQKIESADIANKSWLLGISHEFRQAIVKV